MSLTDKKSGANIFFYFFQVVVEAKELKVEIASGTKKTPLMYLVALGLLTQGNAAIEDRQLKDLQEIQEPRVP